MHEDAGEGVHTDGRGCGRSVDSSFLEETRGECETPTGDGHADERGRRV